MSITTALMLKEMMCSPYILMSKVEGVRLCLAWNDMGDEKRRIILRQVINILLEL